MKKVIGILGIVVISMLLGFSVEWAEREDVSLRASTPAAISVVEE